MFWGSKVEHTDDSKEKALLDLRSKLASTDVLKQLQAGHEPGVTQSPEIDDNTLSRWLVAEDWNVPKAFQRLSNHAPWRAKNFPAGRIQEKDITSELGAKKAYLQGTDKQGRAVSIIVGSKHSKSKRDLEETKRLICYSLDAAIDRCDLSENPSGKVVAVFDLRGINTDAMDTSALHAVFDLMQNHYPERLGMLWMYEASFLFHSIWKVVSPFIDAATKAKIKFIGREGVAELQSVIGPAVLPRDLGGQAEMITTQEAVARMRADSRGSPPADQYPARPASGGAQQASHLSAATNSSAGSGQSPNDPHMEVANQRSEDRQPSSISATGNRIDSRPGHDPTPERLPEQVAPAGFSGPAAHAQQLQPSMQAMSLEPGAAASHGAPPATSPTSSLDSGPQARSDGNPAPSSKPVMETSVAGSSSGASSPSAGHKIKGVLGKAKDKLVHPTRPS